MRHSYVQNGVTIIYYFAFLVYSLAFIFELVFKAILKKTCIMTTLTTLNKCKSTPCAQGLRKDEPSISNLNEV